MLNDQMVSNGEGASFIQPPILNGRNYALWKNEMKRYIKFIDIELWKTIKEGIPLTKSECCRIKFQSDCRAKNMISAYICKSIFLDICEYRSASEMWNTLKHTYEGASKTSTSNHPGDLSESPTMDDSTNTFTEYVDRKSELIKSEEMAENLSEECESEATSEFRDGYTEMNQETTTSCSELKNKANSCLVAKANQKPSENIVSIPDSNMDLLSEANESCNDSYPELKIDTNEDSLYKREVLLLEQKLKTLQNEFNKLKQQNDELALTNQSLVSKIESSAECKRCNDSHTKNNVLKQSVAIPTKENHILDTNRKPFSIKQSLRYVSKKKNRHKEINPSFKSVKRFSYYASKHTLHNNNFRYQNHYLDTSLKCQRKDFKRRHLECTNKKYLNNVQRENLYSYAYHKTPRYTSNFHINKGIKEGKLIWIVKGSIPYANKIGPKKIWVPKLSH
jgi:hypothetical protein